MKSLLLAASLFTIVGCAGVPYDHTHTTGTMETSGVGTAYGIGFAYVTPNRPHVQTGEEKRAAKAANIDFEAITKANHEANAASEARELAELKKNEQLSCEDIAAIGYQVLVNMAWQNGDWDSVNKYPTQKVIAQCKKNRGE